MNNDLIPLPMALPGKEYVIKDICVGKTGINNLKGYGIIPGTKIKLLFASPSGDPCAYEILGAVIALRQADSQNIHVKNTAAPD